jgi:hypothetical protein
MPAGPTAPYAFHQLDISKALIVAGCILVAILWACYAIVYEVRQVILAIKQ